jgi:hypothetical protein
MKCPPHNFSCIRPVTIGDRVVLVPTCFHCGLGDSEAFEKIRKEIMTEDLMAIIVAKPNEFYVIDVRGYIEPHGEVAILTVQDDDGTVYSRSTFNANSGMFNAFTSFMVSNFEGTVALYVTLENANWILDTIIKPSLEVRRVR